MLKKWPDSAKAALAADLSQVAFEQVAPEQAVLSVPAELAPERSVQSCTWTRTTPATGTKERSCPLCE